MSVLGFGCMRFTTKEQGGDHVIVEDEAIGMLRHAIDNGVNYIDTAYPYHDGKSEPLVGKALKDGYREKVFLATKSPVFSIQKEDDFERFLEEQLRKLETQAIDYYLLHTLNRNFWENVVLKFHLLDKMERAKAKGQIRHIGFSFHDEYSVFQDIVDGYDGWEFCQIQLNYIDLEHQAGLKGLHYAAQKGLGVIIMEPLLGGKLAVPPVQLAKVLPEHRTPVEWALDFLWNLPQVGPVLSGMSTMQQVEQNLEYASRAQAGMLTKEDTDMLLHARHVYQNMALVPCTKCQYCMPCPFGLDIPGIYEIYNSTACGPVEPAIQRYEKLEKKAADCTQCGQCLAQCPQAIDPVEHMAAAARFFEK